MPVRVRPAAPELNRQLIMVSAVGSLFLCGKPLSYQGFSICSCTHGTKANQDGENVAIVGFSLMQTILFGVTKNPLSLALSPVGAYRSITQGSEFWRSPRLRSILYLLSDFSSTFEGESYRPVCIDRSMIDRRQPKIIIRFKRHFLLFCHCRSKRADAVVQFFPALTFYFNGFILLLHFLITTDMAFIAIHILSLILHFDGVLPRCQMTALHKA